MDQQVFTARSSLINQVLHGEPCIDSYAVYYTDPLAIKFDPLSREITSRSMCQEIVKEINTLLDMQEATSSNATRYSYLISQQVDLETQQVETFSSCVHQTSEEDPAATCIEMSTKPGYFELYSS